MPPRKYSIIAEFSGEKIQIALEKDLSKDLEQVHPKIFYECSLIWLSPAVGGGAKGSDGDVGWTD